MAPSVASQLLHHSREVEIVGAHIGQEKTNKHKHFGRDGVRDKQEPSLGQTGPLTGTNWDPSLGQTGRFLFNSTVKSPLCPVCPWDWWGFVPGTTVPQKGRQKNVYVFLFIGFFCPKHKQLAGGGGDLPEGGKQSLVILTFLGFSTSLNFRRPFPFSLISGDYILTKFCMRNT